MCTVLCDVFFVLGPTIKYCKIWFGGGFINRKNTSSVYVLYTILTGSPPVHYGTCGLHQRKKGGTYTGTISRLSGFTSIWLLMTLGFLGIPHDQKDGHRSHQSVLREIKMGCTTHDDFPLS